MKILIILERPWQVDLFVRRMGDKPALRPEDFILFCPHKETQNKLRSRGLSFKSEADYHFPAANEGVSDRAYYLSENWWKPFVKDDETPALVERDAVYFFLWILRSVSFVQALLDDVKPDEVWAGEVIKEPALSFRSGRDQSLYGIISRDLAERKNIPLTLFPVPLFTRIMAPVSHQFRSFAYQIAGIRLQQELSRVSASWSTCFSAWLKDTIAALALKSAPRRQVKSEKPVLLISSSEAHIAPVVKEIKERGIYKLLYLRETFSPSQAASIGKEGNEFVTASIKGRSDQGNPISNQMLSHEMFVWQGYSFGFLLKEKFTFLFNSLFPALWDFQKQLESILKKERVSEVLVEEDVCTFNKTLIRAANRLKIPSVVIQHGFSVLRVGFHPLSASKVAVYGEAAKRRFVEWGIPENRIMITGNILHDKIRTDIPSRAEFCRKHGLDPHKKIILLGMFPYRDYSTADFPEVESYSYHYFPLIGSVAAALAGTDYQLVVKLHPRDSKFHECSAFVRKFPDLKVVVAQKGPSVYYSANCDALVTVLSTLLIDTLPFKKPMLVVDLSGQEVAKIQSLLSMTIPVVPNRTNAIRSEIQNMFTRSDFSELTQLTEQHLYRLDGLAAKRAADLVISLLPAQNKIESGARYVQA